jgi:Na+/H+-dicarboxylate symporter
LFIKRALFVLADFLTPQKFSEAMMTITTWVINMAPVGVFFLIGGQVKDETIFQNL